MKTRTPDVVNMAKAAREAGTLLAVVEFLCRTRHRFTCFEFGAECPKLGVAKPSTFSQVLDTIDEATLAGYCTCDGFVVTSKIAGVKP